MSDGPDRLAAALANRYSIERGLGEGGMATVYLAEDLKHQRQVAIKVLKPELAAVLGAERFIQEITTTAQLQHPHILPLFDSGTADGFLFYVMPYVEGETLRDKLDRETQLGVDEAVRITREVADALDYAHRHGVIHRDIKPENILLHDGRPMVADFGIALAVSAAAGGRMTETGMSLGTPHYMSPEQATADKEITGRSDVYSLASVLYEMLTGDPPHVGSSAQQIIVKIIADEARPVGEVRKSVPPNVAAALTKALEKLPADRFESAKAFSDALADAHFSTGMAAGIPSSGAVTVRRLTHHPLVLGLVAALVATAGIAASQWRAAHREAPRPVVRLKIGLPSTMLISNAGLGTNVAVSPDGSVVAYALSDSTGTSRLYLRPLSESDVHVLAGTEGAQQPSFSPDGKWIAYLVGTVVWKVQTAGGTPVQVGDAETAAVGISWSSSGVIIVGATAGLVVLPENGGATRLLTAVDSTASRVRFSNPFALPDGKTALCSITPVKGLAQTRLAEVTLKTGAVRRLDVTLLDVLGYVDGTLVYVLPSGALMGVPFNLDGGRATGTPVALGPIVATTLAGASSAALSPTGTLVYEPATRKGMLGWVDLQGHFTPLLSKPEAYAYPRLSPNGKRIAVAVGTEGRSDILLYDLASGTPTRITNAGTQNDRPEWTPDGRRVLYRSDRTGRSAIWWQPADQSAPAAPLLASESHNFYEGVITPDGKTLVYQRDDGGVTQADIMYRALEGDTASHPVAATRFVEAQPRVSPDGHWVAFVTDQSGVSQVVVQPFPGPGGQVQISVSGGTEPVWARDGKRIFYRDGRHVVAASVSTTGGFAVTGRTDLFADTYAFAPAPHANYDVSPDGTRLLMVRSARAPEYDVVYGWSSELAARMRGSGGR
ncbi:MAG: protein kinase [Gemmatimonadetes bacterium]|nr:protein kinase [Gemmatimonadota bacterium]